MSFWLRNLDKDSFNEQGLKEITEPITAQIQDVAGDVTTLQVTAEGLQSSVADADGKATTAQQTAEGLTTRVSSAEGDISSLEQTASGLSTRVSSAEGDISSLEQTASGLSVRVSDVESRNTVTINANGMYVTDQNGNTTALTGDHIKSGTLEGVTLISASSGYRIKVDEGWIQFYDYDTLYGALSIGDATGKLWLRTSNGVVLKLESDSDMSIDAGGKLYLQTNGGDINIGNGGNIRLNGTVTVNGVKI